jgi:hypothetical protein
MHHPASSASSFALPDPTRFDGERVLPHVTVGRLKLPRPTSRPLPQSHTAALQQEHAQMSAILLLDRTMACVFRTTAENKATHGRSLWHFVSSPVPLLSQFHGGTTPATLFARGSRSPLVAWSKIGLRRLKRGLWAFFS